MLLSSLHVLYIDPGTGSLLLQIVAGGAIAALMFFKRIWYTTLSVIKHKDDSEKEEE